MWPPLWAAGACSLVFRAASPAAAATEYVQLAEVELYDSAGALVPRRAQCPAAARRPIPARACLATHPASQAAAASCAARPPGTRRDSLAVRASSVLDDTGLYWPPTLCADGDPTTYCSTYSSYLRRDMAPNITVRYPCHTGGSSSLSKVVVVPRRDANLLVYAALDFRNASGARDVPSYSFASAEPAYSIPLAAALAAGPAGPSSRDAGGSGPGIDGRLLGPIVAGAAAAAALVAMAGVAYLAWRKRRHRQRKPECQVSCLPGLLTAGCQHVLMRALGAECSSTSAAGHLTSTSGLLRPQPQAAAEPHVQPTAAHEDCSVQPAEPAALVPLDSLQTKVQRLHSLQQHLGMAMAEYLPSSSSSSSGVGAVHATLSMGPGSRLPQLGSVPHLPSGSTASMPQGNSMRELFPDFSPTGSGIPAAVGQQSPVVLQQQLEQVRPMLPPPLRSLQPH
jgi:hypothetical protein